MSKPELIVVGASARAASFSASRAGFSPYWIDQFGDHDLLTSFPGSRLPEDTYPAALVEFIAAAPQARFIYTGALENHLQVLEELARCRPLLGNAAEVCRAVRDPQGLAACFSRAGIPHPRIGTPARVPGPDSINWLIKPRRSAAGQGIRPYLADDDSGSAAYYLQEFIHGDSRAGIFVGDAASARLLGVSRQLVGESFLNAGQFAYCGSIGPLSLSGAEREQWQCIGDSLVADFSLRGLFGVDAICRAGEIFPLEVNPRYTASVEVLERALQVPLIALHCAACAGNLPTDMPPASARMFAKAYLFAARELRSPADLAAIYPGASPLPLSADIPRAGSLIRTGQPLMTVLASAGSVDEALQVLKARAAVFYSRFDIV